MTEKTQKLREGYHVHGELICAGCGDTVDLSDADDLDAAKELWNAHIKSEHPNAG